MIMKTRDVLGIDFAPGRVLAVQLRREPSGPVVTHCAAAEAPQGADTAALAGVLRHLLSSGGFTASAAVMGLPEGRGFFQHIAAEAPAPPLPGEDYVHDEVAAPSGARLRAVAGQADIDRLREIAAQAGVELLAVNLRALGCLRALGPGADADEAEMGIVLARDVVTLLLLRGRDLLAAHARRREPAPDGPDRLEAYLRTVGHVEQMFRLATTVHPEHPPSRVRLVANPADEEATRTLPERLGVSVQAVAPGRADEVRLSEACAAAPADPAAAIGLALEGLDAAASNGDRAQAGERPINLLRARRPRRAPVQLSPRRLAVGVAAVLVLCVAALGTVAAVKYSKIRKLEAEYAGAAQNLAQDREVVNRWHLLRPWRPARHGGSRAELRDTLTRVGWAFPHERAYAPRVVISRGEDGLTLKVDGRALPGEAGDTAVYEFTNRLNEAERIGSAAPGAISEVDDPAGFDRRFSVTARIEER